MTRMLQRATWIGCALVIGLFAGCLADLPRGPSCGDGWWDREFEGCDASSSSREFVEACRDRGFYREGDGSCDPSTCEVVCCGDGVAAGAEACDGNDVRGEQCPSGSGVVRCTDQCTLDYQLCPAVCGDGVVSDTEECEKAVVCGDDDDCGPRQSCYQQLSQCVPQGAFEPDLSCRNFVSKAVGVTKPYASGVVSPCTSECYFGRDNCGFCGDGELDDGYFDVSWPDGDLLPLDPEVCDQAVADRDALHGHCEPLCDVGAINADVALGCNFDCMADCKGFAPPEDIGGLDPDALGCCLAKHSPCPVGAGLGVPALPCCSWLTNPDWLAEQLCVEKETNSDVFVCP